MPVDYSLGKVYKIVGNGKIYVGSTCERLLCQRLAGHRYAYNRWINEKGCKKYMTSFECIIDTNCSIELLELCPCSCVDELKKCEGKWIRDLECVNKKIETRTRKEWEADNKEQMLEKARAYNEANREKRLEYMKTYYQKKKAEKESI